jgi:hypothetical protein
MAKLINLRTVKKQRARHAARKAGDVAAAKHGEPKSGQSQRTAEEARVTRLHDLHKRER